MPSKDHIRHRRGWKLGWECRLGVGGWVWEAESNSKCWQTGGLAALSLRWQVLLFITIGNEDVTEIWEVWASRVDRLGRQRLTN